MKLYGGNFFAQSLSLLSVKLKYTFQFKRCIFLGYRGYIYSISEAVGIVSVTEH
jgi:hypothetical protein